MKLEPKINNFVNNKGGNSREYNNHKKNYTFREKKLKRNSSDIF